GWSWRRSSACWDFDHGRAFRRAPGFGHGKRLVSRRDEEGMALSFRRFHSDPKIQRDIDRAVQMRADFLRTCFRSFAHPCARWVRAAVAVDRPPRMPCGQKPQSRASAAYVTVMENKMEQAPAAPLPHAPLGRFDGIERPYGAAEVERLRGSVAIRHTLAERGANRLWGLLHSEPYLPCLGAMTGNQARQMVRAGLKAIYLSGWQVAADANSAGSVYPDQSLYPSNSGPDLCRRINRALARADQIEHAEGGAGRDWFAPIVADAEAGFGGPLNAF